MIGIVGRLVRLKGHLTLLRAMKDVLAAVPDTFLLVIGEGADEAVFRQEADRLGIADHVIWKGRVEPEVLPQYYHLMDVLAMPSHWEGFGLTAAEAMAAGKPVVGTDVLGPPRSRGGGCHRFSRSDRRSACLERQAASSAPGSSDGL